MRPNISIFSAIILVVSTAARAQPKAPQPPADVAWETNLTYGKAGDVELKCNLAKPAKHDENAKPIPAIVVIHGGGWAAGHRDHLNAVTWQAAQRGYLAITISYRFAPKHLFPAQVEDAKCAVRYLRANAKKLNIDADHIGATGVSAGAHLSMMLATLDKEDGMEGDGGHADHSSKVQAAVSFVGPTELDAADLPQTSKNIVRGFIGGTPEEKAAAYASYIAYYGPFDVDPAAGTVTHHVIASLLPNWVGGDQVRSYRFEGDTLILSSKPFPAFDTEVTPHVVWRRVK